MSDICNKSNEMLKQLSFDFNFNRMNHIEVWNMRQGSNHFSKGVILRIALNVLNGLNC